MPFCDNCGKPIYPLDRVCPNCGTPVSQPMQTYQQAAPVYNRPVDEEPPQGSPFAVLSSWNFVGSLLLMTWLPIAGLIIAIVWASGGTVNINRRNLARAYLLIIGISIVLTIIMVIAIASAGMSSLYLLNDLIN